MKQTKIIMIVNIILYILQIFLMITLHKYTHNNSICSYFAFSFVYNIILSFFLSNEKRYEIKIIFLNIFLAITVYWFGNIDLFQNKEFGNIMLSICFNISIFFFIAGNWMLAFILRILQKIFTDKEKISF